MWMSGFTMKRRTLILCGCISLAFLMSFTDLFFHYRIADAPLRKDSQDMAYPHISIVKCFSLAFMSEHGGYLALYNQDLPNNGSAMFGADDKSIRIMAWGGFGIYFRLVRNTNIPPSNWWTVMVSIWYPVFIVGNLVLLFVLKLRSRALAKAAQ